jgi:beta-D-xylosidase 4
MMFNLGDQCNVSNTGDYDADDVVLGFIIPPNAGQNGAPLKVLFGFERVFVPKGKSVTVFLYPQLQHFLSVEKDGSRKPNPGLYTIQIGIKELPTQFLQTQLEAVVL